VRRLVGLESARPGDATEPVVTVGVFDGVHRGHSHLLYELRRWSESVGGTAAVLTFDRHPVSLLRGVEVPMILSVENRLLELERHGVDLAWVIDFGAVRDLSPGSFLRDVLVGRLGCRRLLLGFDSTLGKDRAGNTRNLPRIGEREGVEVRVAPPVFDKEGKKISSTAIRDAIRRGDLEAAANVLGRPFTIRGPVVRGAGRGRALGIATANLDLTGQLVPPDGVYLVRVYAGERTAAAVANLGVGPTFGAGGVHRLEVHVPGWSGDLYGETLEVRLVRRLRDERRFPDAAALRAQIETDLAALAQAVASGEL